MILKTFFTALIDNDVQTLDKMTTDDFKASFVDVLFFGEHSKTRFLNWAKDTKFDISDIEIKDQTVLFSEHSIHKGARFKVKNNLIFEYSEYLNDDSQRYCATVSYNGQNYYGYQRQLNQVTIQGTIEEALLKALQEKIEIHASGRTDRGVHAIGQVIHFDTTSRIPVEKLLHIINAHLPLDIRFLNIKQVSKAFHARYDVVGKEYIYKININKYNPIDSGLYWYIDPFNIALFKSEINKVIGEHDFFAFCKRPTTSNTTRTINTIDVVENDGILTVSIMGNGFLRHMVRFIVGACVMIASKKVSYTIDQVFLENDNQMIKDLAAPSGLYLNKVFYEE